LTDRPSITLPLCVLGAGLVHGICIAVLLPVLVSDPGPATSEAGTTVVEVEIQPQAEAGRSLLATANAKPDAGDAAPELVTGSIAQAAASVASAIARMPREDLRQAEPRPATLASAAWPAASLRAATTSGVILVKADAMVIGTAREAAEELEAEAPPAMPITATDGQAEAEPSLARVEPAAAASPPRRKQSAPAPVARAKPKPKPAVAAVPKQRATTPAKRAAPATTRQVQTRVRTIRQPAGLGLFLRKPQAARQPSARR
jgi:hypothetical protein